MKSWKFSILGLLLAAILLATNVHAQQRNGNPPVPTDLALQNLSRVSASAEEIKAVLIKDEGLMVELKRWVAKDATDHGQIVGETDLTNYAIFDRLTSDLEFRAIATLLVQKYGYLLPKLNPESDLAKEQDLMRVERTKWMAQAEEEQRAEARQKASQELQKAAACDARPDRSCPGASQEKSPPENRGGSEHQIVTPPPGIVPGDQYNTPILPNGQGNPLQRGPVIQTGMPTQNQFSQSPQLTLTGASGNNPFSLENQTPGSFSMDQDRSGTSGMNGQFAAAFAGGNSGSGIPNDGLLSAFGMGSGMDYGTGAAMGMLSSGFQPNNSLMNGSGPSPLVPMQPNRWYPEKKSNDSPDMVRRTNPYEDVPSLMDMYMQTVARPSSPKRFGAEIFENGTRDLQLIPMDLPAGPDYVVGPGDGLSIDLWGSVSQRLVRVVDRGGQITLPEAGPVLVSGQTLNDVQQKIQQILKNQFRDVSAGVSLSRLRTIRIYEVGDVMNAGAYDISSLSTPLNALFVAGGPSTKGSMRLLNHYRGNQLVQTVDVYDLLLHGVKANIERLENGDTVQVPPIGPQVTIEGMVRRPAIYELHDEKNLASVLELAGGLLPAAALRHIEVQRLIAHEKQTMLSIDIPDVADKQEVTKKLESFEIHDGDRIRIYPIAPYNQDTIYVEGHVPRPGRYSFRPGMRVTDILASYKDILPEPATQYAEIIRLNAPDFRPSVESFSLGDALADPAKAPVLQPMDTLRIFSRFDFENPPMVAVMGDVRAPGTYKTAGQIHLADAVHLAGGLTADAQRDDAQVFRYLPNGEFKIFSVNLGQALVGDPVENIMLEPRDRLLVHRNPDSIESAAVYVQGEVGKPGRYPLTTNMRVADLIRVGGGLKPSADTESADLTQYDWSNQKKLAGHQTLITISAALTGDVNANMPLRNGDVLTIRQLPGWNDLGASIAVRGEVKNTGVYGIRPGERLSTVLQRAGGFQSNAYAYGAILQRVQVRELEMKEQSSLIQRAKSMQASIELMPEADAKQKQAKEAAMAQYQATLERLTANPPIGRVTVRISSDIDRWKNTAADIEVRAGDTLIIPKKPSYVMVTGQVFNPTAIAFRPGKSAAWYLTQAGGPTQLGTKKSAFVIRADGSVISSKSSMWSGDAFSSALQPGDTVVVPERPLGGPPNWQAIFSSVQLASSVASTVFFALHY